MEIGDKILEIVKSALAPSKKVKIIAIAILSACGFLLVIFSMIIGQAQEVQDPDQNNPATGSSWEQFIRYMITKEGGSHDDTNYWVEDDGYGVPTIGHGLALYNDGHGHKAEFEAYGIDTVELVKKYKANPSAKNATVSIEICDEIYKNHIKGLYDSVISSYESYNLKEYQYYALTDVKYRRGNLGSSKVTSGFSTDYKNLWSDSDNEYGSYVESNEKFDSENTLFHFFWDGGHSLEGVRTRKHDQWVIFKYGYYRPLKEYWQENSYTGDLYNDDGTISDEKVAAFEDELEKAYNLVEANIHGNNTGGRYNPESCKKVTGKYIGWSGKKGISTYSDCVQSHTSYLGNNGLGIYQCTWWANGRASEHIGKQYNTSGDGGEIYGNARGKYNRGSTPKPNSLVSYVGGSDYGHVAYVEAVDDKYYVISHCGSGKSWYGLQKVEIGKAPWSGWSIVGFVYLDEPIK